MLVIDESVADRRDACFDGSPELLEAVRVDAPVWPWSLGGWLLAALFVFLFVYASANR